MSEGRSRSYTWRKSRFSGVQDCVEWRLVGDEVQVRSSRQRDGGTLSFTRVEWEAFLAAVKAGEAEV